MVLEHESEQKSLRPRGTNILFDGATSMSIEILGIENRGVNSLEEVPSLYFHTVWFFCTQVYLPLSWRWQE